MKFYLQFLLIVALITANISPACQFMGTGFMELCGVFEGKSVPVDAELSKYFASKDQDEDERQKQLSFSDCPFCFSGAHLDKLAAAELKLLPARLHFEKSKWGWEGDVIATERNKTEAFPRAPPLSLA